MDKQTQIAVPEMRPEFSEKQIKEILDYTWEVVVAAVLRKPMQSHLSQESEHTAAFGVFTTLKKGHQLRACKGLFSSGQQTLLGGLLRGSASSSATSDPRFPPITPEELPFLHMDISLMHTPEIIRVKGETVIREVEVGKHGLRISHPQGSGLLLPQVPVENGWDTETFLRQLCRKANLPMDKWKDPQSEILRFQCVIFDRSPQEQDRTPAVAGSFYPSDKEEIQRQLEALFKPYSNVLRRNYRAIMLPHAGWRFCGEVMAKTLAGVQLPKHLIVIGPKHTSFGANWSASKALKWKFPGSSITIDSEKACRLCELVPELSIDNEAHAREHGIEVQVPFFYYNNPHVRMLPIALGRSSYEMLERLAKGIHELMKTYVERPLLVISSDMNHFDAEEENRRKDYLALDAMQTGDPHELYSVCQQNAISMCGMLPAVVIMKILLMETPHIKPKLISYTNSAKISGDMSRVVGYAGVVIE